MTTPPPLETRAQQLVVITGATGFIGRTIAAAARRDGWPVRGLVRQPDAALAAEGIDLVTGALEDEASLRRLVAGAGFVIHCAGAIKARTAEAFHTVNAAGTERLLAAMAQVAQPSRLILMSSLAAREPSLSAYAASKRAGETIALADADTTARDLCIVRPPAVYGPGDLTTLGLFRTLGSRLALLPGRSDARFSLIFVEDLAELASALLRKPSWGGQIIEPDDGQVGGYRWADLVAVAGRHLRRSVRPCYLPAGLLWGPVKAYEAVTRLAGSVPTVSTDKLRELFHRDWVCRQMPPAACTCWQPRVQFSEGFARTWSWYTRSGWI